MNQDEYTPVPITLQPRSPYFALLDFCHFKANEMSERQGGRDSRGEENERKNKDRKSKKEREREGEEEDGLLREVSMYHGHPRSMLNFVPSHLSRSEQ